MAPPAEAEIEMPQTGARATITTMEKRDITPAVVARLVAEQFPQWADLPIQPVPVDGWDNTTFRLGRELSARLPSADRYVAQVYKEHRWLPILACHLPLPIPEPVAMGQPGSGFPRPWSVYRWIEGDATSIDRVADLTAFAADLARFLAALHTVDTGGGPPPGQHNFFRGGPLATYDAQSRRSIELLAGAGELNAKAATQVWDAALVSVWEQPPVWVHGDVAPSNLLVAGGRLRAVIDFGGIAVGDPACDLVMAWTFFTGTSREAFRHGLPFDDATWARARGWALWKALVTIAREKERGENALAAARGFGWSRSPRGVVDLVLADHDRSV